ncbi:MAG: DUF2793 domain-containing protein [Sphingopyxis sp.]|nr:DUF2793 domain-containing protein [Sphingopyxis sp.]
MPDVMLTPRLSLPLLATGQAQKEITHNEALALIDALLCPAVEAVGLNAPVAAPQIGLAWIVGPQPVGEWAGQAQHLAVATAGGWRFADVPEGATLFVRADGGLWRRVAGGWQAPQIMQPVAGGATIDSECRTSLSELISALAARGLIAMP